MKRFGALLAVAVAVALPATARAQQPPPVPPQLQPVLDVFGPSAAPGCRTAGLVGSTLATRGLADAYQALNPAFVVCGYLPPPTAPVACPADKPLDSGVRSVAPALGSLLPIPTPLGTTIDTFTALNALVAALTGHALPPSATTLLVAASGCVVPNAPRPASGDRRFGLGGPSQPPLSASPAGAGTAVRAPVKLEDAIAAVGALASSPPPPSPPPPASPAAAVPSFANDWGTRLATSLVLFALLAPFAVKAGAARR